MPEDKDNGYIIHFPSSKIMFVDHHFTTDATLYPGLEGDHEVNIDYLKLVVTTLGIWHNEDSKLWG